MTKKKKKRISKKQKTTFKHVGKGIFIGFFLASLLVNGLLFGNIQMKMFTTGAGDFNVNLMGLRIREPYGDTSKSAVIFSDEYGNPYIDEERTNWNFDSSLGTTDFYNYPLVKNLLYVDNPIDADNKKGWVYGAPNTYSKLVGRDNSWYGASGATIDIDGMNTGVPDLTLSINNMYPSDSNGEPDDTYSYKMESRTLIDDLGNTRTLEIGMGFLTLEIGISIIPDYYLGIAPDDKAVVILCSETAGDYFFGIRRYDTFGGHLSFDAVFRIGIKSLDFGEYGTLNPDWINIGNGILGVHKRGFGAVSEIDEPDDNYLIGTQDTTGWSFPGSNDIIGTQNQLCPMFDSAESAIDKLDPLVSEQSKIVDFKKNNPSVVYFSFGQLVELGLNYQTLWQGNTDAETVRLQMIHYVQRITVQFYTSVCKPLAGVGYDPVKMLIDLPDDPPPKERLWDKIANWIAEALGIKRHWAVAIMIAVMIVVPLLVILILLAIFAPQVFPMMAKVIAGFFKRRATKRATRK